MYAQRLLSFRSFSIIDWLFDFKGTSTRLDLFYALS